LDSYLPRTLDFFFFLLQFLQYAFPRPFFFIVNSEFFSPGNLLLFGAWLSLQTACCSPHKYAPRFFPPPEGVPWPPTCGKPRLQKSRPHTLVSFPTNFWSALRTGIGNSADALLCSFPHAVLCSALLRCSFCVAVSFPEAFVFWFFLFSFWNDR